MSTPLPPELTQVERALEETRARLPPGLRARVLEAARRARSKRETALSPAWFAAAVAVAAALLLSISSSAALISPAPAPEPDACAITRALQQAPELCRE